MSTRDVQIAALQDRVAALEDELRRSRRWSEAWKAAATWRFRMGVHKSKAWHLRRQREGE